MLRILTLCLVAGACAGDAQSVAMRVLLDTLVINGPSVVEIPVSLPDLRRLASEGASQAVAEPRNVASIGPSGVRCLRAGDATVRVMTGAAREQLLVRCRPIASFAPSKGPESLFLGGPPVPLRVLALDSGGYPVNELRFTTHVQDTSVAVVENGDLLAMSVGKTRVRLDFDGVLVSESVEVVERIVDERVVLARGESLSWVIEKGRYRASLTLSGTSAAEVPVSWFSERANCALDGRSKLVLHCVVAGRGRVVLRAESNVIGIVHVDRRP